MRIRVLGCHHTETKNNRLSTLLIDDHIALDAGAITSTLSTEEQANLTDVVITHHHFDHTRDLLTLALGGFESGQTISVFGTRHPSAWGNSKKEAEQRAALNALQALEIVSEGEPD